MIQDPLNGVRGIGHELLSFRIGEQSFCIDIMAVREIRGWTPTTPLPRAPSYVRGTVSLRGVVLPIIDLGERLGLGIAEPTPQHVIIVAEVGASLVGLLVSAVSDILTVTDEMIQPTPDIAAAETRTMVRGLLTIEDRMVSVLGVDHLVPRPMLEAA